MLPCGAPAEEGDAQADSGAGTCCVGVPGGSGEERGHREPVLLARPGVGGEVRGHSDVVPDWLVFDSGGLRGGRVFERSGAREGRDSLLLAGSGVGVVALGVRGYAELPFGVHGIGGVVQAAD